MLNHALRQHRSGVIVVVFVVVAVFVVVVGVFEQFSVVSRGYGAVMLERSPIFPDYLEITPCRTFLSRGSCVKKRAAGRV